MTQPVTTPTSALAVLVIDPDGTIRDDVMPTRNTLRRLYQLIGCRTVDVVRLDTGLDMWLDDEGMVTGQVLNASATAVARTFGLTYQPYFGTVVLTGGADGDGNTVGLVPEVAAAVRARIQLIMQRHTAVPFLPAGGMK